MLKNQVLKRKLIISKKNDFFKSSLQILFNRTFINKKFHFLKPFYINKYVSKHSSYFFPGAYLKMKFPLEGKSLCVNDINILSQKKLYKHSILIVKGIFLYLTSINIFIYNAFVVLKILTKIFFSFIFILTYAMFFLLN